MFGLKAPKKLSKGSIVLFALGATITGFTSLKTIDLLKFTMPPDQQAFAWFGWACFELGLAAWIYWHGAGSRRDQRTISGIMIVVNLLAVIVAFVADTILVQARKGGVQVDANTLTWAIIVAVSLIAAANLAAVVGTQVFDPDKRAQIRQEEYAEALQEAEEQANHKIQLARLQHIARNADAIAPQIGYQQGVDWTQQQYQRWALPGMQQPMLPPQTYVQPVPPAKEVTGHLQAAQPQADSTGVLHDKEDYLSLLDKAVKYGQISEEKAQPLRDMIRATSPLATPASLHQNGHVTPGQPTNQAQQ